MDRSKDATGLIFCRESSSALECDNITINNGENSNVKEVYINSEVNFPENGKELKSQLILCENSKCYVPSDDNFRKGKIFTNKFGGLIMCEIEGECQNIQSSQIKKGYYVNGLEKLTLIYCDNESEDTTIEKIFCSVVQAKKNSYYLDVNNDLIFCDSDECATDTPEFSDKEITLLNSGVEDNNIIRCSKDEHDVTKCYVMENPNDYFIDNSQKALSLIKCNATKKSCEKISAINRGIYISDNGENLIKCNLYSCEVMNDPSVSKYYLNGEKDGNIIIKNNNGKWTTEIGETYGVYVNGNGNKDLYPVIYCKSENSCEEIDNTGDNIYMNVAKNYIIKQDLTIEDFTNIKSKAVAFLVDENTSIILKESSSNSKLVVCAKLEDSEEWSCEIPTSLSEYYINPNVYGSGNNLIITNNNSIFIESNFVYDKIGYYFNNKSSDKVKIIKCSKSGCEEYTKSNDVNWCKKDNDVGTIKENYFCTKWDATKPKKTIISDTTSKYLIDVNSSGFPIDEGGFILVSVDKKKVVPIYFTDTQYYLIIESSNGNVIASSISETGNVYKCEGLKCEKQNSVSTTYPNSDNNTKSYNIYCDTESTKCKYTMVESNSQYCLSKNNKLQSCTGTCFGACVEIIAKNGYYLPFEKNFLINCTGINDCSKVTDINEGYYKSQDIYNQLIRCDTLIGGIRCDYDSSTDGYYIKSGLNLIKCTNNQCEDISIIKEKYNIWLLDSNGKLIKCPSNSSTSNECEKVTMPKLGLYFNKRDEYLISCSSNDKIGKITCSKIDPIHEGFYYTVTSIDEKYLIEYSQSKLTYVPLNFVDDTEIKYFVNGEDKKLIKCSKNSCEKLSYVSGWYISDKTKSEAIKCFKNTCALNKASDNKIGYYVNGDQDKLFKPMLENNGEKFDYIKSQDIENGWYIDADESRNSMIQCTKNGSTASCITENMSLYCSSNSAKFVRSGGIIKWCVNDEIILPQEKDINLNVVVPVSKDSNIQGIKTDDNNVDGISIYSIGYNKVIKQNIDGFFYDSDGNELYFCYYESGLCEKYNLINGGYFLDYTNHQMYKCNKNDEKKCIQMKFNEENPSVNVDCDDPRYNVVMRGPLKKDDGSNENDKKPKTFYLCKTNEKYNEYTSDLNIGELNIDYIYAIENKKFPYANTINRYILVNVNKYSVIFRDYIKEVDECPETGPTNDENDKETVCLTKSSTPNLVIKKTFKDKIEGKDEYGNDIDIDIGLQDSNKNIEINIKNVIKSINSDYDTNKGYFIYTYDTNNKINKLKTVYIKIDANYKYECEINDACLTKEVSEEPFSSFKFENGVLLVEKSSSGAQEITTTIKDGTYIDTSDSSSVIECINEICNKISTKESEVSFDDDGQISINLNSNLIARNTEDEDENLIIKSNALYNLYIFKKNSKYSKKNINDDEEYYLMMELSSVQYSNVITSSLTNIFIDKERYKKLSNENSEKLKNVKIEGYTCLGSKCYLINKNGYNHKYFLNSVQNGKKENAIAKCGNGKCEFINASDGIIVENSAATGENDAIIECTNEQCDTKSIEINQGLPTCKYYESNGEKIIEAVTTIGNNNSKANNCINLDTNTSLQINQNCILEGVIYNFNGEKCEKIADSGIKLFDVTYRSLDINDINENHYGTTLYDCTIGKCFITYGYIIGTNSYVKCDSTGCYYDKFINLKNNCNIAGEGALIFNGENVEICNSVKADVIDNSGYYPVTINVKDTFPEAKLRSKILLNIVKSDITTITMIISDGFLLLNSNYGIIENENNNDGNMLYKCSIDSKKCELIENPINGYYISNKYNNIISCTDKKCVMTEKIYNGIPLIINDQVKVGFGSKTEDKYFVVKNNFPGYSDIPVIAKASEYNINILKTDNFVLINDSENRLANKKDNVNKLYICNSSIGICDENESVIDGWYISGQTQYKAIKCESGFCQVVETLNDSCSNDGEFIFNNGQYIFCGNNGEQIPLVNNIGKMILFKSINEFPNNKNYVTIYSNYVSGIGIIDQSINSDITFGIIECTSQCKNGSNWINEDSYCILNSNIYRYHKIENIDTNPTCEQQFKEGTHVEIFHKSELATTEETAIGEGNQMFYCKDGNCHSISGYKKFGDKIIFCNFSNCKEAKNNGSLRGEIRFGNIITNNGDKSFENNKYYLISGNQKFPSMNNVESFIVEVNSSYVVQFKGEGYYLINSYGSMLTSESTNEGNKLYYCNSNYICKLLENNEVGNGYYFNSAIDNDDKYKKGIIECISGTCKIAGDSSIATLTNDLCTEIEIGKLVKDKTSNGVYKICTKVGLPENINIGTGSTNKFFAISLGKGSSFGNIIVNNDNNENIIIENTEDYIRQYNIEGYIILNNNGEILSNIGPANGELYYCKKNELTPNEGVKCNQISEPNNGWYFNNLLNDKQYIQYDSVNKFEILNAVEVYECDTNGRLIFNEGFKLCHSLDKIIDIEKEKKDILINIEKASNFPGINADKLNILLSIEKNAVIQIKMKTNVIVDENNVIDNNNEGKLYQCDNNGECKLNENPNDNYYLKSDKDGNSTDLIYCENKNCKVIDLGNYEEENVKYGFRIGSSRMEPLIQCVLPEKNEGNNEDLVIIGKPICEEREFKEGWYLNADSVSCLIRCTKESGCFKVTDVNDGWYLNSGINFVTNFKKISDAEIMPIIQCKSKVCTLFKSNIDTTCNGYGNLVKSDDNYKLCIDNTISNSIDLTKRNTIVIENKEYPSEKEGFIVVITGENNAVIAADGYYLNEKMTMYSCVDKICNPINSDGKNGAYIYENINEVLFVGTCFGGVCKEWKEITQEGNYILNNDNKLVTTKEETIKTIYECLRIEEKIKCKNMKDIIGEAGGHYLYNLTIDGKTENVIYKCDGEQFICTLILYNDIQKCSLLTYESEKNYCYISYEEELDYNKYNDDEPKVNPGGICINEGNIYFAYEEINTGIDKANCECLNRMTNVEQYYYVKGKVYSANKYYTRDINSSKYKLLINSLDNSVLIGKPTSKGKSIWKDDNNNVVKCYDDKCNNEGKIKSCIYEFTTGICESYDPLNAGDICYSSEGNIYIIVNSNNKCVNYNNNFQYSIEDESVNVNDKLIFNINNSIYSINQNNEIFIQDEGVYIIDDTNKLINIKYNKSIDISDKSKYKMYICTRNGCTLKNICGNGLKDEYMYYNGILLKCDAKSNTLHYIDGNGYYINDPWENLMICFNGSCNIIDEKGMEGYYIDSGNYKNVIKCVREIDKFKCISEKAIECNYYYDSLKKITSCKSEIDLKKNSYCIHINNDDEGNNNIKMFYIENYIKANDYGICIENDGNNDKFYHYKNSIFLNNIEKNEIIKLMKNAIVKLYEKDLGYYIISKETRMGITSDTNLNKSIIYECTKDGCFEQKELIDQRIYVNKASSEKMARYQKETHQWEVIKHKCEQNPQNKSQCMLSTVINKSDIIYTVNGDEIKFLFSTKYISTSNVVLSNKNSIAIKSNAYLYVKRESSSRKMYIFDKSQQYFEIVDEPGYYIFESSDSLYNLIPYKSTVNSTDIYNLIVFTKGDKISEWQQISLREISDGEDTYILNKADLNNEGLALQVMKIKEKVTSLEVNSRNDGIQNKNREILKVKAVINKCNSYSLNKCINIKDNQILAAGDICVVVEGDYKGLYLATDYISNSSTTINCIKYNNNDNIDEIYRTAYQFIGNDGILFAGNYHKNTIVKVQRDIISLIRENNENSGYYIIDTNKRLLSSTSRVDGLAYKCETIYEIYSEDDTENDETLEDADVILIKYICQLVEMDENNVKYIYDKFGRNILYDGKWEIEKNEGYYYYNKDWLSATINDNSELQTKEKEFIEYSNSSSNDGYYINNSNLSIEKVIIISQTNNDIQIIDYKECIFNGNTCSILDYNDDDFCYSNGKLYLLEANEGDSINCYTGTKEDINYRFVNNEFYRLDGDSIQKINNGIYILNNDWKQYSTTSLGVPDIIIYCNNNCQKVNELNIEQDVIINAAGTGNNILMKYDKGTNMFVNVSKEGFYFFNDNGIVDESSFETNSYYLKSDGNLKKISKCSSGGEDYCIFDIKNENSENFNYNSKNIYLNNAKEGSFIKNSYMFINDHISFDNVNEKVIYDKISYNAEGENKFVLIENTLYRVNQMNLEEMDTGFYALFNSDPFEETNWTNESDGLIVCYYVRNSGCSSTILESFKKQKYAINKASKAINIIEYNSDNEKWRKITENSIFYIFEDWYSTAKIVIACTKDDCENGTEKYVTSECTNSNSGKIRINDDDRMVICSDFDTKKNIPVEIGFGEYDGPFIVSNKSRSYPDSNGSKILFKYEEENKIERVEDISECTKDLDIILENSVYYLCSNVNDVGEKREIEFIKIPFEEDGAIFAEGNLIISINKYSYKTNNPLEAGYYIDRSGGCKEEDSSIIIHCKGEGKTCISVILNNNDIFQNAEYEYNRESGTLIYCKEQNLIVEGQNVKPIKCSITSANGYFTNTENELIKCENYECETTIKEELEEKKMTGYYVNGNSSNDKKKPIIYCENSTNGCKLLEPNSDYTNYINNGKEMSIIHCTRINNNMDEMNPDDYSYSCIIKEASPNTYYPTDNQSNKIIQCNDRICTEIEIEQTGYYIDSGISGNIIECSRITNKCISKQGYKNTSDSSDEYYVDGIDSSKLILCNGTKCSSLLANAGIYINGAEPQKLIICKNVSSTIINCDVTSNEITSGYFVNSGSSKNKLIACDYFSCTLKSETLKGFYMYTSIDNVTVSDKILIYCDSSSCTEISGNESIKEGYYINAQNQKLIKCGEVCETVDNPVAGHYINALYSGKLIECIEESGCAEAEENSAKGFYFNASAVTGDEKLKLIHCDGSLCAIQTTKKSGLFINGASESSLINCKSDECIIDYIEGYSLNAAYTTNADSKKLIYCKNNKCTELTEATNGYYFNSNTKSSGNVILCDKDKCQIITLNSLMRDDCSEDKYKLIENDGLHYCNGNTKDSMVMIPNNEEEIFFYKIKLSKNSSSINYPILTISDTMDDNTKEIIVEVSQYSVIQYIGYICLDNDKNKYCEAGDHLYNCSSNYSECTVEIVEGCSPKSTELLGKINCNIGYHLVDDSSLYYCDESNNVKGQIDCTKKSILGYFVNVSNDENAPEYIKCIERSNIITCIGISKPAEEITTCTEPGILINGDEQSIKLCIDKTDANAIDIFKTSSDQYIIPTSIFTSSLIGKYYIAVIDENSIQKKKLDKKDRHFIYTFTTPKVLLPHIPGQCSFEVDSDLTNKDLREYEISSDDTYKYIN